MPRSQSCIKHPLAPLESNISPPVSRAPSGPHLRSAKRKYSPATTNTRNINENATNTTNTKHRKNCKSCQSQVTWKVKFKCQFCPVLSCRVLSCPNYHDHHDHHNHHVRGDHEEVGSYMRKLEVVHKEVGGCLISYNLRLASVRKLEVI